MASEERRRQSAESMMAANRFAQALPALQPRYASGTPAIPNHRPIPNLRGLPKIVVASVCGEREAENGTQHRHARGVARKGAPQPQQAENAAISAPRRDDEADARAREIEQQMTDDERFSLVISVMGAVPGSMTGPRDVRIPEDVRNMSAG